ncbi:unnamed protein product [Ixodes persulcatus]
MVVGLFVCPCYQLFTREFLRAAPHIELNQISGRFICSRKQAFKNRVSIRALGQKGSSSSDFAGGAPCFLIDPVQRCRKRLLVPALRRSLTSMCPSGDWICQLSARRHLPSVGLTRANQGSK